jgi:hypothetical protein
LGAEATAKSSRGPSSQTRSSCARLQGPAPASAGSRPADSCRAGPAGRASGRRRAATAAFAGAARGLGQRGGVPVSLSEVTPCPCGIHPGLANSSARCPTSARSSSRKRAQSARRSSETNSPGSSDWQGGFLGCSLGPDVTPHPRVEDVDNSESGEPQTPRRLGLQAATSAATLRVRGRPDTTRTG